MMDILGHVGRASTQVKRESKHQFGVRRQAALSAAWEVYRYIG